MGVVASERRTTQGQIGTAAAARILQWMQVETGASVTAYDGTTTGGVNKGVWGAGFYGPGLEALFTNGIYVNVTGAGVVVGYE